jgi:hypothetical protein
VGFVVDKVALKHVFPRVLWFSPVNFIPPVLHYKEKRKQFIIFITRLHNKPQGCVRPLLLLRDPSAKKKKSIPSDNISEVNKKYLHGADLVLRR